MDSFIMWWFFAGLVTALVAGSWLWNVEGELQVKHFAIGMVIVIAGFVGLLGFLLVAGIILMEEYGDKTIIRRK